MTAGGHIRGRSGCCLLFLAVFVAFWFLSVLSSAHGHSGGAGSGGCPFSSSSSGHDHHHDHHHHEANHDLHYHGQSEVKLRRKLPEELAEEEDLELERLLDDHHDHHHHHGHGGPGHITSKLALWTSAMGCSLLVSLASLICLIFLPVLFLKGKPSKIVVDSLATFGAGAMLGDAFLHQLPHAFGGEHSHSHDHGSHSHSLKDLSVGLSVLSGIILFLLVEKLVRYVENISGKGADVRGHGHHHHSHMRQNKLKDDDICDGDLSSESSDSGVRDTQEAEGKGNGLDGVQQCLKDESRTEHDTSLRQRLHRNIDDVNTADLKESDSVSGVLVKEKESSSERSSSSHSSLVFGYLNLFSDGVHNFTDGMALGSAFLLYGSVGGWSRTLFLLAHELPQEIGDFGILIHSGFTVSKALVFNFLSALVALAGTALALLLGKDPGHSSLIEGFTAGGFIYIAVAGVLPEMNSGSTTLKSTAAQLTSLILGMAVALCISLVE